MSTNNKSSSLKPKKSTTNKNRIGKSKKKQPSYFDPYVTPKSERNFLNEDLNSFWKFTPRNPLNARKNMVNISSSSPFYKHRCRTEPTYSPSSSAGNMSSILTRRESDNTAAVIEARREIEKIKTELETLINANIKTQTFYKESMSLIPPDLESLLNTAADACNTLADAAPEEYEQVKTSPSRLTPMIRSSLMIPPFDRRKIVHQPDPEEELIAEGTLIDQNRPKSRTYDPEKMREFIKQQKIRRREKLQEEECKKRQMENARKHKLEELKKKTFELVAKNLKKSSAGKSAKLLPSDINTNPSKSNAQIDNSHGVNKFLLQSRRCRARSFDHSIGDKTTTTKDKETDHKRSRSVSRENNKQSNQKIPENQTQKSLTPKTKITKKTSQKNTQEQTQISPKTKEEPKIIPETKQSPKTIEPSEIIIETLNESSEKRPPIIPETNNSKFETEAAKELTEIKHKLETSITQIKEKNEVPSWLQLQPPSSIPYPYNFISAVRKKLELVTRQPPKLNQTNEENKLNVSIQCSIDKKILDVNSVNIPKLIEPESHRKKSYDSHKCRRQLYPQIIRNEIEISYNKKSDSDSDTTKNIPELPHEKELKNITFDRNKSSKINIGEIKLPEPVKKSKYPEDIDSILSHYSKIKSDPNSYSDDFTNTNTQTEYKQIPDLSKSGTISEHLPPSASNTSNRSTKEHIIINEKVSTDTNITMKDVPSLLSTLSPEKLKKPDIKLSKRKENFENNHIHLKLQAEVHLLNSFNNSLRQVVAVEKSLFDVPSTSGHFNPVTIKRGCDFTPNLNVQVEEIDGSRVKINKSAPNLSLVNVNDNDDVVDDVSVCSQDLGLSNIVDGSSISTVATQSIISRQEDQFNSHPYVTISLDMVDQMIKDEDIRLEHLKAVLKLRDQALFDRIKGELALLEIRKRELREHGLTNDITAIKKKQRGLIIKLQQERHEMHRLKTAHKQAAKARKSALHQQKSIIKTQLTSTDHIPKKLRRLSHSERPSLGPVKVYRVDSKTEISETQTLSRKNSDDNSFTVTTTNSSVVTQISEKISVDSLAVQSVKQPSVQSEKLKRSLLMKEAEIDKRRVEIEELIKWQKRLKQKEAEVVELENQAVKQLHSDEKPKEEKVRVFSGAHLNKVWKAISLPDQNFDEQKKYQMSKRSLDKFYQNARKMFKEVSEEEKRSKSDYSMDFEQMNSTENEYISQKPISSSSEDLSSLQQDQDQDQDDVKSVSVSESSVKTEVNIYHKTDSIQSEFIDSLNRKIASQTDSLEPSLVEQSDSLNSKLKPPTSELPVEQISTNKSECQLEEHIDSQISSATTEPQIEEENIDSLNSSSAKVEKKIVSWDSSIKSDSQLNERIDSLNSSATTEPQIEENVASLNSNSSIKSSVEENIVSLNSSSVKSEPLIEENVDSLNSSPKSDPETDENIVSLNSSLTKSEPQIEENVVSLNSSPKTDENIVSLSSSSVKSEPQIEEIVVSLNSSPKSEPQIEENVVSLNSSTQTESQVQEIVASLNSSSTKSKSQIKENVVSEATQVEENIVSQNSSSIKLDTQIEEIVVSLNSSPKSKSDTQLEEIVASLNSSPKSEDQIEENVVSLNSSLKSDPETDENVVSLNSSPKSESRLEEIVVSPKSETVQIEENIISPNSSPKSEAVQTEENTSPKSENHLEYDWEPQIISELNTKTNTAESQTTPRSELYETDFDESLKETNVDSTNESIQSKPDETENDSDTVKVSPKDEFIEDDSNNSKKGVSHIDVRKRVSEILADANANGPRGDKSPRVQDLYTTTYDIAGSSESTPESGSPTNEFSKQEKASFGAETPYVNEAEELLRKQLEIEQEIKRLERQQQNIPYLFMREIPNKPPPPYKPPDFPLTPVIASIIPSKPEQTKKIINEATDILFTAYTQGEDLTKTSSNRPDDQQRFMFDLCKEIAIETCKPTLNMERKPASWRSQKNQFQNLFAKRPHTKNSLNSVLNRKVLQLLNFEPISRNDSLIIRWSRKKRDHVDEILVSETQAEEAEWTNFDSDEDVIKDNLTQNILEMLIVDAAKDASDVLMKKKRFSWIHC